MKAVTGTRFGIILIVISLTTAVPIKNEVFSLDNTGLQSEGKTLSITVNPDNKNVGLTRFSPTDGEQRVVVRINSDNTFTLFPETQPWNWVEHIVELTKFVRIQKIPQVLAALGPSKEIVEQNYQGRSATGQKWYLVPTGSDPNTGVITNLLLRECLTGQGENEALTLTPCNWSNPNQIFTLTLRTLGRRA